MNAPSSRCRRWCWRRLQELEREQAAKWDTYLKHLRDNINRGYEAAGPSVTLHARILVNEAVIRELKQLLESAK